MNFRVPLHIPRDDTSSEAWTARMNLHFQAQQINPKGFRQVSAKKSKQGKSNSRLEFCAEQLNII